MFEDEITKLIESLKAQEANFESSLILNPVENVPNPLILTPSASFLHGLYSTDSHRENSQKIETKIQFSGRNKITDDTTLIYSLWAKILGGEALSMRLLSGLHAHIVLFMSITEIGQRVLALPEKAGGHTSSYAILKRLGLNVYDIPYDNSIMRVDRKKCEKIIEEFRPDVIFVDRSEGLIYEDFTWLGQYKSNYPIYKIFDASQYLTNILCGDYNSPFNMGFDLILSTLHKNLPGPQRALVCAKQDDETWRLLRSGISTYVSNMHVFSIYSAGLLLNDFDQLAVLSKEMLVNTAELDKELAKLNVPIVDRKTSKSSPLTHHCWIGPLAKETAFDLYLTLESIGLMTNYRLLPYDIGYGLRLGLSGATQSGLRKGHIPELAAVISEAYHLGYTEKIALRSRELIKKIKNGCDANERKYSL